LIDITKFLYGASWGIAPQLFESVGDRLYEVGLKQSRGGNRQARRVGRYEIIYFGMIIYQSVYKFNPLIFF